MDKGPDQRSGARGMSRVLLVGGTGFIGARLAARLAARGLATRTFDLPAAIAHADLPGDREVFAGDVTDAVALEQAAEGCDGIVNLAGIMTMDCARDPVRAINVNVLGSVKVFEVARRTGATVAYLSSAGVFGPDDASTPEPLTLYGVTKLAVEGIARVYAADHGVASLGLRPYVVYGPGVSSGIAAGPSIAIAASVRRQPATIRFSGRVGFTYVDDVADMLAAAVTRPIAGATVLTMAGDTRGMDAFLAELARQTGWSGIEVSGPPLRIPSDLASDPVPAALGDHPVTTIETGIAKAIAALTTRAALMR